MKYTLLLISILIYSIGYGQSFGPTAAFAVDTMVVCKGDCISFTDLSTGDPTSWSWSFQGAEPSTSTAQNPTNICFDSAGVRSEEHTSELQSRPHLVCRLLLEK